jgi:hypothetical protein
LTKSGNATCAASTASYSKDAKDRGKNQTKCYNYGEAGHMTPDCPKLWTEKSKEAMKKKDITRKSVSTARAEKKTANAASSSSTNALANAATSTTMHVPTATSSKGKSSQSVWIVLLSDINIEMNVSSSHFILFAFTALSSNDKPVHIIDTSAMIHCTPYHDLLFNVHIVSTVLLTIANSEQLVLNLAGDMVVEVDSEQEDGTPNSILLQNVYFNSLLPFTLISVGKLDLKYCFTFYNSQCSIFKSNTCIGLVHKINNLYMLLLTILQGLMSIHKSGITMFDLYKKLDHISYHQINKLLEMSKLIITTPITNCMETLYEDCIINNICRNPIPKKCTSPLATAFGDHFHINIFGFMPTESITGKYLYWLTIVNDAT